MEETHKICKKCGEDKELSEYYKMKSGILGKHSYCKACIKLINAKNYDKATWRHYYLNSKDHYDSYQKDYYSENVERIKKRFRGYYEDNKDNIAITLKKWRKDNPEKVLAHREVRKAVVSGELPKPDKCECCNKKGFIEFHHLDYSKPLQGVWLKRSCHRSYHGNNEKMVKKINAVYEKKYS